MNRGKVATYGATHKFDDQILQPLAILQFHSIRWLSWGQVSEWILYMTTISNAFQVEMPIGIIKLQPTNLCFILWWMCWWIQTIWLRWHFSNWINFGWVNFLKSHFLCGHRHKFGQSTKNLGSFLSQAWVDDVLRWRENVDVEGTYHPIHDGWILIKRTY